MTATDNRRSRARKPWEDELLRLRWLERKVIDAADGWRVAAAELRSGSRGSAALIRAAELDGTATTVDRLVTASHAGPDGAAALDWARWHAAELGGLLAAEAARDGLDGGPFTPSAVSIARPG